MLSVQTIVTTFILLILTILICQLQDVKLEVLENYETYSVKSYCSASGKSLKYTLKGMLQDGTLTDVSAFNEDKMKTLKINRRIKLAHVSYSVEYGYDIRADSIVSCIDRRMIFNFKQSMSYQGKTTEQKRCLNRRAIDGQKINTAINKTYKNRQCTFNTELKQQIIK